MAQRSPTASSTMAMEQAMPSKLLARIVFPSCRMAIAASIATALESLGAWRQVVTLQLQ